MSDDESGDDGDDEKPRDKCCRPAGELATCLIPSCREKGIRLCRYHPADVKDDGGESKKKEDGGKNNKRYYDRLL